MAIDNSLHNSLEATYFRIKNYLENVQLTREHSEMIVKNEELAELLETLDIEAIEEQSKDIHTLHATLNGIKEISQKIAQDILDPQQLVLATTASELNEIFSKIKNVMDAH